MEKAWKPNWIKGSKPSKVVVATVDNSPISGDIVHLFCEEYDRLLASQSSSFVATHALELGTSAFVASHDKGWLIDSGA